ncbi:hypothetical protein OH779_26760 [Actinacidiphila glaucinigra]|uniref:hypothetical protein n=1 Tax=Actinacidiphila glaucinigra TaxID=235986 RepID=UPI00386BB1A5
MAQVGSVLARREIDAGVGGAVPVLCLSGGDGAGCVAAGVAPDSGCAVAARRSDCRPPERSSRAATSVAPAEPHSSPRPGPRPAVGT